MLATKVSPETGNLQLSLMAGEHLAQLGSKQKKSLDRTMEVNVESAVKCPPEQPASLLKQKTKVISLRALNTKYSVKV